MTKTLFLFALMITCLSVLAQGQSFGLKSVLIKNDTMVRFTILTGKDTCAIKTFGNIIPPTDCGNAIHKDSTYIVAIESSRWVCTFPVSGSSFNSSAWDLEITPDWRYYRIDADLGNKRKNGSADLAGRSKEGKPILRWIGNSYRDIDNHLIFIKEKE